MKIVIDTNVVISAVLRGRLPAKVVRHIIVAQDMEWIASPEIFTEYVEVLWRPRLRLHTEDIMEWTGVLDRAVSLIRVTRIVSFPRDHKDAKFVACAAEAGADFLITGDRDFSETPTIAGYRVVTVREFANLFLKPTI
jgi:putative PIN family toxin of toxin-antitoxin system